MTPEREAHLIIKARTMVDEGEMIGFVRAVREQNEMTSEVTRAVLDVCRAKGWEMP